MELAFALFNYFPYGGLERDMLVLAQLCSARGHRVTIYTQEWQGDKPADLAVVELPVHALTNHGRATAFIAKLRRHLEDAPGTVVVGFNKMPGLDFYYAADVCYAAKAYEKRGPLYRRTPRCRHYLTHESAVFGSDARTQILMISRAQIAVYQRYYETPDERLHLLPPGIRRERILPMDYRLQRPRLRAQYGLDADTYLLLQVGSDFKRKGLDRSIRALAMLPEALRRRVQLWVAGRGKEKPYLELAQSLGVAGQLRMLGGRDDISELMWAADLLLHPAYTENTGTVLLEAMVAGLPVIASSTCGYAHYIEDNQQGAVLDDPTPQSLAAAIGQVLAQDGEIWRQRGRDFAAHADIFAMTERAAELIERLARDGAGAKA
jgi:UDP-glucose:(heptosyl)LPS alpha-1,3-glucosyltransferase